MPHTALIALCVACGASQRPKADTAPEMTQYLVATAAKDFQEHAAHHPTGFRGVHVGYVNTHYVLCGEFQSREEWTSFVTIKTSDYEQMFGAAAASWCHQPSITWTNGTDLSATLQSALER